MFEKDNRETRILEFFLILTVIGLTTLLHIIPGYKMIVLNLFYLPVVLAAFFLGRYRAGVLALLCIISASVVTVLELSEFAAMTSPVVVGLSVTIWASVLGMISLLVGTLSDERTNRLVELNEAYVGVIDVLSRYLQSADQKLRARSLRVAELSKRIAAAMKLAPKQIDDIRVAALLHDIENLEITAKVIQKAVGQLDHADGSDQEHTFHGTELAHSLGTVLTGAFPLLLKQDDSVHGLIPTSTHGPQKTETPLGARIIRTVRAYDVLVAGNGESHPEVGGVSPEDAISLLRRDTEVGYDAAVLDALEVVVLQDAPLDQLTALALA